jgi:hypothetical protein
MTTYGDMLYMLGGVPVGSGLGDVALAGGKWYFCDPTHGNAQGDALTPQSANSDLLTCYNLTRDGYNDGVVFIGGATAWNPSTMLTWSNTYTHLIGTSAQPGRGNRCRIVATAAVPLVVPVTFSGDGCVIRNIQINNEGAAGAARGCAIVTAQRCLFENVFFMCPTSTDAVSYSLKLSGGENTFVRCTIGQHTLVRGAASYGLWVLKGAGDCQGNKFIDCEILSWSSVTTHVPVKIATDVDVDNFTIQFENLLVSNIISGAGTLGHAIIDGATNAGHQVILKGICTFIGCGAGISDPVTYTFTGGPLAVSTVGAVNPGN